MKPRCVADAAVMAEKIYTACLAGLKVYAGEIKEAEQQIQNEGST